MYIHVYECLGCAVFVALPCYLFDLACFFLPSSSLIDMYNTYMYIQYTCRCPVGSGYISKPCSFILCSYTQVELYIIHVYIHVYYIHCIYVHYSCPYIYA